MEQRRREQEHHEKQQELQQLKHKDKSQQSESIHTLTLIFNYLIMLLQVSVYIEAVIYLSTDLYIKLFQCVKNNYGPEW